MTDTTITHQAPSTQHAAPSGAPSILQRLASGESRAMEACLAQYGGLVQVLARRHLANVGDVDDGVQEVFIALWQCAERFDPQRGSELAFVATLAQRKLIDHRRKAYAHKRVVLNAGATAEPRTSARPTIDEDAREADRVLRSLSPDVQDALVLSLYHGRSFTSVAASLGAPTGTVKSWASRGLNRLRERLAPHHAA